MWIVDCYEQGMAYSQLSGLPPVYGLFSAFIPPISYALLGSSMHLAVGPVVRGCSATTMIPAPID